jgi:hypothetical protein
MKIKRFVHRIDIAMDTAEMVEFEDGGWVQYEDYLEMSEYADRLVAHKDMVCLPADLKNLREANTSFAIENEALKKRIAELLSDRGPCK